MNSFLVFFVCYLYSFNSKVLGKDDIDPSEKLSYSKQKLATEGFLAALKDNKGLEPPKAESLLQATDSLSEADLGITLPPQYANDTITEDHHTYFNSTFYGDPRKAKEFWVDLDKLPEEKVITHKMLSDSHRQASTIELSFEFPFYGSLVKSLTVATGGFLYMGDYLHNWIAATQYIAPLMANFDTTLSEDSKIKYADNGTAFTIQWDHVYLQDREKDGAFTFQTTLFKNGDICFAYKEIPFPISEISDDRHPVKVGISDAYILETSVFYVRRKTIYEYHRIDMLKKEIKDNTAIFFTALPTCLSHKDCSSCIADKQFECKWCETVKRCSDGIDRQRQHWVINGCSIQSGDSNCGVHSHPSAVTTSYENKPHGMSDIPEHHNDIEWTTKTSVSPGSSKSQDIPSEIPHNYISDRDSKNRGEGEVADRFTQDDLNSESDGSIGTGVVVAIIVFVTILLAVTLWMFYAYKYPQSSSGQFLIKYRPSQWSLKSGEGGGSNTDAFKM